MEVELRVGFIAGSAVSFYERWVLPPLLDLVMRHRQLRKYRRAVIPEARGRVLEIGVGSGLNFPLSAVDTPWRATSSSSRAAIRRSGEVGQEAGH